jgi:aminomethyltransferase
VISRTGWSGEYCYEIYLCDSQFGEKLWESIMAAGEPYNIRAIAPNTIRSIEGGLLSYCSDITVEDNPWSVGMGRFVHFDKESDFVGREALLKIQQEGNKTVLVGVEIDGAPIAGNDSHWPISVGEEKVGHITRCTYSPRLERNIGWAKVLAEHSDVGTSLQLQTPGGDRAATVCETPWFKSFVGIPDELKAEIRNGA